MRSEAGDGVKEMILQQLEFPSCDNYEQYLKSGKDGRRSPVVLQRQNPQGPLCCCVGLPWINASLTMMDPSQRLA